LIVGFVIANCKSFVNVYLFFYGGPHLRVNQIWINLLVTVNENDAEGCRDQTTAGPNGDVVALADVVDVNRNGSV
jgi:hypothetical protein